MFFVVHFSAFYFFRLSCRNYFNCARHSNFNKTPRICYAVVVKDALLSVKFMLKWHKQLIVNNFPFSLHLQTTSKKNIDHDSECMVWFSTFEYMYSEFIRKTISLVFFSNFYTTKVSDDLRYRAVHVSWSWSNMNFWWSKDLYADSANNYLVYVTWSIKLATLIIFFTF